MKNAKLLADKSPAPPDDGNGDSFKLDIHEEHSIPHTAARLGESPQSDEDESPSRPRPSHRPKAMIAVSILSIAAIAVGVTYYLYAMGYESTDDAFIEGHVVPISPRVAGHVAQGVRRRQPVG